MVMRPWKVLKTEAVASLGFATLRKDLCAVPGQAEPFPYFVLDIGPWVNVVAFTVLLELIFVEQYRHAAATITREIPAGGQRQGETGETAARRELLEETGFAPKEVFHLGSWHCNPALQTNVLSTYLATGCVFESAPPPESGEQVIAHLIPRHVWTRPNFLATVEHYFSLSALRLAFAHLREEKGWDFS